MQRVMTLKVSLDPALFEIVPTFKLGLNHYTKITVSESPQMLKGRLTIISRTTFFRS